MNNDHRLGYPAVLTALYGVEQRSSNRTPARPRLSEAEQAERRALDAPPVGASKRLTIEPDGTVAVESHVEARTVIGAVVPQPAVRVRVFYINRVLNLFRVTVDGAFEVYDTPRGWVPVARRDDLELFRGQCLDDPSNIVYRTAKRFYLFHLSALGEVRRYDRASGHWMRSTQADLRQYVESEGALERIDLEAPAAPAPISLKQDTQTGDLFREVYGKTQIYAPWGWTRDERPGFRLVRFVPTPPARLIYRGRDRQVLAYRDATGQQYELQDGEWLLRVPPLLDLDNSAAFTRIDLLA